MRRKTLLTVVLCTVLATAAQGVSSDLSHMGYVRAEEGEAGVAPSSEEPPTEPPETDPPQTDPPPPQTETSPPQTEAPQPPQTDPPQTEAPPQTEPVQTEAPPQTEPTQTDPPQTDTGSTGSTGETGSSETSGDSGSTGETGGAGTETGSPETSVTEGMQPSTETVPTETETAPTETPLTETLPTESSTEEDIVDDEEEESETEEETEGISNDELIARQTIVIPPDIEKEFRFTKVDKRYAIVRNPEGAKVFEDKAADAREVGTLNYYGYCYILDDQDDGWYYIESGNVRGFIRSEDVVADEVAERIVKIKGMDELSAARLLLARTDNEAFTYTHTTVQDVMASPEYALADGEVSIYEQKKESSREVGALSEDDLCYILADAGDDWVFVESGDARGFVEKQDLATGKKVDKKVSEAGEENLPLAEVLVEPEDNKACYYTLTSVKEASQAARTREAMVNFATQFVGNPYVWGGTSLTQGADCSGFVQSVYSYFGYSLPRVAEDQAMYGMQIPIESAEPGDLIFYARNGYVYHVSMYIGDGQVIQAAGRKVGIIISGIGGNAVWATRVIHD